MKTIHQKSSLLSVLVLLTSSLLFFINTNNTSKEAYRKLLKEHPYSNPRREMPKELAGMGKPAAPDLAWEQDYLRTMDPTLGRPAQERLPAIIATLNNNYIGKVAPGSDKSPWVERGPNNVGGRTRALAYDPSDPTYKKVWAGGVTGGLWYNNDITSANSSWVPVNDFWQNIAISCIAFDPLNPLIIYVGTGEGFTAGGSSSARGAGIWKTIDGGNNWNQITSTQNFFYVLDIVVRAENNVGVVYAAVDGGFHLGIWHGNNNSGIHRSVNGGSNWTNVSPNIPSTTVKLVAADLEIAANGRIWAGSKAAPFSASNRGGGRIFYSDNGTTWITSNVTTVTNGKGRVELACAPSDSNTVYAVIENDNKAEAVKKTTNGGATWVNLSEPDDADNGIPSTDFTRGQAWYDLILAVDPNNANIAIIGGIDLFRTTDGGSTWPQISKWSNNNNLAGLSCALVHADQHAIMFRPGSSSTVIFGNDGGVYYSSNIAAAVTNSVIADRNKNYNVTQYYAGAIHPTLGSNIMLAGSQDNGTQRYATAGINATDEVYGGDGAFCFIDQINGNYQIASYVYNNFYRSSNAGFNFTTTLLDDDNTGKFINPADYDNQNKVLYTGRSAGTLYRVRQITSTPSTAEIVTIPGMSDEASHISASPYSSAIFVGTDVGEIFKVSNANGSASSVKISTASLPAGSVSCVEIGASENELIATFFNYGVTSVWYTDNGGTSWVNKEGNLPDMPIRWALFNPNNRNEVILATELGVWASTNFKTATPTWQASNKGLANVRVDMLQVRTSDYMVMAITHGRGVYTSNAFSLDNPPNVAFTVNKTAACLGDTITLKDTSNNSGMVTRTWSIFPANFQYVAGTNAQSAEPKILFTSNGQYAVQLKINNGNLSDSVLKQNYIRVGGIPLPFSENWENSATYNQWEVINPDGKTTWTIFGVAGNGSSTLAAGVRNFEYGEAENNPLRDGLVSPQLNLAGLSQATLSFKHAYRRFDNVFQDSLAVFVSTDCGNTWIRVASFRETQTSTPFNFITNSNLSGEFTPTSSSDWCGNTGYATCKTVNLNAFVGSTIKIKFENISVFGNNLFLDDINVTGVSNEPPPVADFTASATTTCALTTVNFTDQTSNNPHTWNWTFTPNTVSYVEGTSSNSKHPKVQFLAAGNYTVTLNASNSNTNNQKVKTNYISVTAANIPSITISTNNGTHCQGTSASFGTVITNGGNAPQYAWFVNGVQQSNTLNTFITSTLNDKDTISCLLTSNATCAIPASSLSNKIIVNVNPKPNVSLALTNKIACYPETAINLSGGLPSGGIYSGIGVSGSTFNALTAGVGAHIITYSFTGANGCVGSAKDTIYVNGFATLPVITQVGNTLTCDITANSYQWYNENSPIIGANNKTFEVLSSGNYAVEVIDVNGCKQKSIVYNIIKTSVNHIAGFKDLKVYQIPGKEEIIIEGDNLLGASLSFMSLNGSKVMQQQELISNNNTVNTSMLSSGIYLLVIRKGQEQSVKKIRIE
jgi:PKD repeat protein